MPESGRLVVLARVLALRGMRVIRRYERAVINAGAEREKHDCFPVDFTLPKENSVSRFIASQKLSDGTLRVCEGKQRLPRAYFSSFSLHCLNNDDQSAREECEIEFFFSARD